MKNYIYIIIIVIISVYMLSCGMQYEKMEFNGGSIIYYTKEIEQEKVLEIGNFLRTIGMINDEKPISFNIKRNDKKVIEMEAQLSSGELNFLEDFYLVVLAKALDEIAKEDVNLLLYNNYGVLYKKYE